MTLTQRAQATAAALCFSFVGIFALGLATGAPAQAEWIVEIKAVHEVQAFAKIKAALAIEKAVACELVERAHDVAAAALADTEI
jgi:hypothetical protein